MKEKILFIPYLPHLSLLYTALDKQVMTSFVASEGAKAYVRNEHFSQTLFTPVHFFGLESCLYHVNVQTAIPLLVKNFGDSVKQINISTLVCFDFYHWYTLQAVRYKKKHPEVKLVIYSETKRWPRNWLSRAVMRYFLAYVRRNSELVDGVLVYTEEGKLWWKECVPEVKRVMVLPAPVDVEIFKPKVSRVWLLNDTLRILMNARYSPYKRHEDLFQAVSQLVAEGCKLHVTLIGRGDGGLSRVQELVSKYELMKQVTFLDPLPMEKMPELYQTHDVLVLPSYNEAIGMVVPEAMACGLPTITSDTVGANVYVRPNETGFVFETGNVEALKASLRQCFNPSKLAVMGEAGRTRVATQFTPAQVARQFVDFLQELS